MSELRPENRALFATARADYEPSGEDRVRVGRALGIGAGAAAVAVASTSSAAAALPVAGVTAASTTALPVVAGLGGVAVAKWAVVAAVVVVAGGGAGATYVGRAGSSHADRPVVVAQTPTVATAIPVSAEVPPVEPAKPVEPAAPLAPATPPRVAAPTARSRIAPVEAPVPASEGGVEREARLLREADVAVRGRDFATATARLDEHARVFPSGVLVEERELERMLLLCAEGDRPGARARAATFLEVHPGSLLRDRARAACAADTTTVTDGVTPGH